MGVNCHIFFISFLYPYISFFILIYKGIHPIHNKIIALKYKGNLGGPPSFITSSFSIVSRSPPPWLAVTRRC